jgi:hypothetical protein
MCSVVSQIQDSRLEPRWWRRACRSMVAGGLLGFACRIRCARHLRVIDLFWRTHETAERGLCLKTSTEG